MASRKKIEEQEQKNDQIESKAAASDKPKVPQSKAKSTAKAATLYLFCRAAASIWLVEPFPFVPAT